MKFSFGYWIPTNGKNLEQFQAFGMIFLGIIGQFILLLDLEDCDEKEIITARDWSELVDNKVLLQSYTPLEIWGVYVKTQSC